MNTEIEHRYFNILNLIINFLAPGEIWMKFWKNSFQAIKLLMV